MRKIIAAALMLLAFAFAAMTQVGAGSFGPTADGWPVGHGIEVLAGYTVGH
jgi:hypothetical protein